MSIYWAAYDGYEDHWHKTGSLDNPVITLDRDKAWGMASEAQREFCRHQADAAIVEMEQF